MRFNILQFKIIFVIFLLLSLNTSLVTSQKLEGPIEINITDTHSVNVYNSAKLVWQENQNEVLTTNFTLNEYPTNTSEINIILIQYATVEATEGSIPRVQKTNSEGWTLSTSNSSFQLKQELSPSEAADRFYFNVSFVASAIGGGADQEQRSYSFRFPESSTILVERDNIVPVINLYGFPPSSFFVKWLPVYGSFLLILALPSIVYGVSSIRGRSDNSSEEIENQDQEENLKEGSNIRGELQ